MEFIFDDYQKYDIYFAFYKGNYRWWSRVIRWWTRSPYSHCEFYIVPKDASAEYGYMFGISDNQRVRVQVANLFLERNKKKWDLYRMQENLKINNRNINKRLFDAINFLFTNTQGKKYDWKGLIFANLFNRKEHDPDKYTCSEWLLEAFDLASNILFPKWYITYTPGDVYNMILPFVVKGDDTHG